MAVPPPSSQKAQLRRCLRRARKAYLFQMDPQAQREAATALQRNLQSILSVPGPAAGPFVGPVSGPIAGYLARGSEADIVPFLEQGFAAGRPIALPHVIEGHSMMTFTRWHPGAQLCPGVHGTLQTQSDAVLTPAVVLAPLVGFDRSGHRLGQGGGFYDRWFALYPSAIRIGVAWSVQEASGIPTDPWDMPLHAIVTEKEWIVP